MYFLKNLLLYSQALIRQTKYVVMMTKEGSTKIVNFMTTGAGVLVLGRGHRSHIVKMHYFFKNLLLLLLNPVTWRRGERKCFSELCEIDKLSLKSMSYS